MFSYVERVALSGVKISKFPIGNEIWLKVDEYFFILYIFLKLNFEIFTPESERATLLRKHILLYVFMKFRQR